MNNKITKNLLQIPLKYVFLAGVAGAALYWGALAQDRYVSEVRISVRSLSAPESSSMLKVITGLGSAPRDDEQLIKDRLQSLEEAAGADAALGLAAQWKASRLDPIWHLQSNASREDYLVLWRKMVSIEVEEPSGALVIKAQGFTQDAAHNLAKRLVLRAENFANSAFNKLAADQLAFATKELEEVQARLNKSRAALAEFQLEHKLVDLDAQAKDQAGTIAKLEGLQAEAQAELMQARATLTEAAPAVVALHAKVSGLKGQISELKRGLSKSYPADVTAKWATLKREVEFHEGQWKASQTSVERVRVESQRKLKSLIVLEPPQLPDEAAYPGRWSGFLIWAALMALLTGCLWLIRGLVKEQSWRQ